MTALEQFIRETVEVNTLLGLQTIMAWRHGYFAVHARVMNDGHDRTKWSITHLPSGVCFRPFFPDAERAAGAALAIAALRDDWAVFQPSDASEAFLTAYRAVVPLPEALEARLRRACEGYRIGFNGYGRDA